MVHPTLNFDDAAALGRRCGARSRLASGERLNAGTINDLSSASTRCSRPLRNTFSASRQILLASKTKLLDASSELGDLDRRCRSGEHYAWFAFALNPEMMGVWKPTSPVPHAPSSADNSRRRRLRHR